MSVEPVQPLRLGRLLSMSYAFCLSYWKPIALAAVVLGTISALLHTSASLQMERHAMQTLEQYDFSGLQEITQRMQGGDPAAQQEMMEYMEKKFEGMTEEEIIGKAQSIGFRILLRMLPLVSLFFILGLLLQWALLTYVTNLSVEPTQHLSGLLKRSFATFPAMVGVVLWSLLRSFVWIPVIGIIPAIILLPRFALAPAILVRDKAGVTESVRRSYRQSEGYWAKIVGNMFVASLCILLAGVLAQLLIGMVHMVLPFAGVWLTPMVNMVMSAYIIVFTVQLSLTIMAHPLASAQNTPSAPVQSVASPAPTQKKKAPPRVASKRSAPKARTKNAGKSPGIE